MEELELILTCIYERVPDDMAPKDGKIYYWVNKRNYRIIEEGILKNKIKELKYSIGENHGG